MRTAVREDADTLHLLHSAEFCVLGVSVRTETRGRGHFKTRLTTAPRIRSTVDLAALVMDIVVNMEKYVRDAPKKPNVGEKNEILCC